MALPQKDEGSAGVFYGKRERKIEIVPTILPDDVNAVVESEINPKVHRFDRPKTGMAPSIRPDQVCVYTPDNTHEVVRVIVSVKSAY